jgi:hypothetical protein
VAPETVDRPVRARYALNVPRNCPRARIARLEGLRSTAVRLWHTDGVMTARHATPFGELPGAVVINFAVIDAAAHAWDLSASLGRAVEFPPTWIPRMTGVVGAQGVVDVRLAVTPS